MTKKCFNSKILLFGEYAVVRHGNALCIPYPLFEGALRFPNDKGRVDQELRALSTYLSRLKKSGELLCHFDVSSFEFDVGQGLYFDSTIPQGYGVGSSGALIAAVYDRYKIQVDENEESIPRLKKIFSQMESHFHGSSSGIDPLISYINKPIIIDSAGNIGAVDIPDSKVGSGAIFLLNTGRDRKTEPLVNLFLEKCKTESFSKLCDHVLLPINDSCVSAFLEGDYLSLYEFFRELSDFQFRHFSPMIPKLFNEIWSDGLKYENYYLKLCGAGGGGFLLGMTQDFDQAAQALSGHEIRPLFRF